MVRNRSGELVSVASVASLTLEEGVNNIRHFGLNRAIRITAIPAPTVSSGEAIDALTQAGDRIGGSNCLLYTSPSPRDRQKSRMPSSA